ncbi:MAG: DNA-binding transcriptional LysR family regulator [Colwellia sp.]|jgi:DNA-binding transcriptional LysR family regulator|tara:strand:- start:4347 stop:5246 length:900 start_codon:yes stop_codon:yes gene_type:complete
MKIDLNLFVVFDAIYCEGNITKAGSALNLSQPAVSHSLSKLRVHFDDPLFVRQGNEMRPTPVANNVVADVREALHQLQVCLAQSRQFEPSISRKNFNISLHGAQEASYLPPLMHNIKKEAPYIKLQSSRRVNRSELENKLASGDIDLAIDTLLPVSDNIFHTKLGQNELVVLARKDHPDVKSTLDLDRYLAQDHVLVSSRSAGLSIEDFELARLGLQRKIDLRCQHAFSACRVITGNNMLLTLTKKTAMMYAQLLNLVVFPLPVDLPDIGAHLYWHRNVDLEPANKWLREQVILSTTGI